MKYACVFIAIAFSFLANSQPQRQTCKFDTSEFIELTCYLSLNNDTMTERYEVKYHNTCYHHYEEYSFSGEPPYIHSGLCDPYYTVFDEKLQAFKIMRHQMLVGDKFSEVDTIGIIINWKKVRGINIYVHGHLEDYAIKQSPIDLSELIFLKRLQPEQLNSIYISEFNNLHPLFINLSQWPIYDHLKNKNQLKSIQYDVQQSADKHLVEDLLPFTKVEEIFIPKNINSSLTSFPALRNVKMGNEASFHHNLALLPNLERYFELNVFNYAMQTFYLNAIKKGVNAEYYLSMIYETEFMHPIQYLDKTIEANSPQKRVNNGEEIILNTDLNAYYKDTDTVAKGLRVNGEKVGIWEYRLLNHSQMILDPYYFDHSSNYEVSFPKNGDWEFKYHNGVTAISGRFKKNLKEGEWKFYKLNGDLELTSLYVHDQLLFSETRSVTYEGKVYNTRSYILSDDCYLISYNIDGVVSLHIYGRNQMCKIEVAYSDQYGGIVLTDENRVQTVHEVGTKKFDKLIYKHYLKYLYPEYKKGKFPFQFKVTKK
ncbi:MAG: antitoxin component YwqK of YwqJK toxin-antitoxin module [Crocinitomicaceae bacterium]|jgi:antitoxin component YwqK of YwqJK toxin-antitoxin module